VATYSGTIDLRVTGNAEQKAELIKKRINEIKSIANSLKPVPNLFDKRGNDAIVKAKEELKKLVEQYGKGTGTGNRFSNTIAGLNQQLNGFNRVLGNVNIKSDQFVQSLTASEKVSRRLARAEAERLKVQTQINTANTVGRATSVQETLDLGKIIPKSVAGLELYQRELQETLRNVRIGSQDYQDLARAIADVNRQLAVAQGQGRIQGPALPPGFSEKGRIPKPGRRGSLFQNIATGAGFPLLFGGGPLQAVAGGIGGAFGGLGGSIAASAIASQVEAFAAAAAQTGVALTSTAGALELMREKSLFSTDAARERAAVLEEQGRVEELAAHLAQEMADAIGNNGVKALQDLGETTKETTRLWNLLTTQLFRLVSGPLDAFLKAINQVLSGITTEQQFKARRKDLGAEGGAALDARVAELMAGDTSRLNPTQLARGKGRGIGALSRQAAMKQALGENAFQVAAAPLPVTAEDRRRFAVSGGRAKSGRAKRARESQLPQLQAEVALQERLGVLSRQVAKAKAEENSIREAALNMEIELEKQASRIEKINLEKIPTAEKLEKIKLVELATDEKIFSIQDSLNQARAKQAEKGQEVISSLENEKALLDARLKGTEDEVALTQLIAEKTKGLNETDAERVTLLLQGVDALKKQVAQADKMEAIYQQIGQSIASGVVDTLSAAVDQTKSLADAAANTLRNVANILLQLGVNTALQGLFPGSSLFSGLQGFAGGGRPPVNKPSIVGERGPELFVPSTSGTIVPNGQFGGGGTNVVVNVDAKGSSASGDTAAGKQLGGLIGAAVQAELIKQKRPGGLLAG
jgi:hypothetical protein